MHQVDKVEMILLGDKNATSLCSKNISTLIKHEHGTGYQLKFKNTFKSIVCSGRIFVEFDFLLSAQTVLLLVNVIQVWYCVKIVPENSLKVLKSGWIKELLLLKVKKLKVVR